MALKQGKHCIKLQYQVELSYVGRKILNQINFIYIFIILVDQKLASPVYIELTVSDSGLKLYKSVVFAIFLVDIQEERKLNKSKEILI